LQEESSPLSPIIFLKIKKSPTNYTTLEKSVKLLMEILLNSLISPLLFLNLELLLLNSNLKDIKFLTTTLTQKLKKKKK
jgi:hypothetical protein